MNIPIQSKIIGPSRQTIVINHNLNNGTGTTGLAAVSWNESLTGKLTITPKYCTVKQIIFINPPEGTTEGLYDILSTLGNIQLLGTAYLGAPVVMLPNTTINIYTSPIENISFIVQSVGGTNPVYDPPIGVISITLEFSE